MDYNKKYLKYKQKYLDLQKKSLYGGGEVWSGKWNDMSFDKDTNIFKGKFVGDYTNTDKHSDIMDINITGNWEINNDISKIPNDTKLINASFYETDINKKKIYQWVVNENKNDSEYVGNFIYLPEYIAELYEFELLNYSNLNTDPTLSFKFSKFKKDENDCGQISVQNNTYNSTNKSYKKSCDIITDTVDKDIIINDIMIKHLYEKVYLQDNPKKAINKTNTDNDFFDPDCKKLIIIIDALIEKYKNINDLNSIGGGPTSGSVSSIRILPQRPEAAVVQETIVPIITEKKKDANNNTILSPYGYDDDNDNNDNNDDDDGDFKNLYDTSSNNKYYDDTNNGNNDESYVYKVNFDENQKIIVIGDIHGSFHTLFRLFMRFHYLGIININTFKITEGYTIIFLGDILDRGGFQIETLYLVFNLLNENFQEGSKHPKIIYNRGNHETSKINSRDGFKEDVIYKCNNDTIFDKTNELLNKFPVAVIINNMYWLCHGGIPNVNDTNCDIPNYDYFKNNDTDIIKINAYAANQIMWNDFYNGNNSIENKTRKDSGSCNIGTDNINAFLKAGFKFIIRGHSDNYSNTWLLTNKYNNVDGKGCYHTADNNNKDIQNILTYNTPTINNRYYAKLTLDFPKNEVKVDVDTVIYPVLTISTNTAACRNLNRDSYILLTAAQ
jgi:hypothetical protein